VGTASNVAEQEAKPGPSNHQRAIAVLMFPIWFWPLFCFPFAIAAAIAITVRSGASWSVLSGAFVWWLLLSGCISAVGLVTSAVLAFPVHRSGTIGYMGAVLGGGLVTLALSASLQLSMPASRPLNWQTALPALTYGLPLALIGRFAMARLGILPSRWPQTPKS
jgi:hypothetical protein